MAAYPTRFAVAALLVIVAALPIAAPFATLSAPASAAIWRGANKDQPAVGGHDPVAYFAAGKAEPGSADMVFVWNDATFRFASAANRAAFIADPEKYAPQFGGYCAWAASQNRLAGPDPTIWHIVDGKLYLNCSKDADAKWLADVPGNIARGEAFWETQEDLNVEP